MPAMRMIQIVICAGPEKIPMTLNPHAIGYFVPDGQSHQTMVLLDGKSFMISNDTFKDMAYLWGAK